MFPKPSSWLAKAKFKYNTRRLIKANARVAQVHHNMAYKGLVRVDRDAKKEAMMMRRRIMDTHSMPFVLPRGPQDECLYVVYQDFYCILPAPEEPENVNAVRAYSEWLTTATKGEHGETLRELLKDPLKGNQTAVAQLDTVCALNSFLLNHKFALEGYLFWSSSDNHESNLGVTGGPTDNLPAKSRSYLTLVYHRANHYERGIEIDPNLFALMEAQNDSTTNMQISSNQIPQDLRRLISEALKGIDTNITRQVPTDKALYASVTCLLKPDYSLVTL